MNELQGTIIIDIQQLNALEGFLRFKNEAYKTEHPQLAGHLLLVANLLTEARASITQDIENALERHEQSFSKAVKSPGTSATDFLQPMEKAEVLASAFSDLSFDPQLNTIGQEIFRLHKRIRSYNLNKISEIKKLLENKTATITFLLGQLGEP